MATHNKTLQLIATKLGLADEDKVLRKAAEFQRLLQTKMTAGINLTDTSKVVICLDLASFALGVPMDTKSAMKYSGLKPSMYTNCRKVVENLLELNCDKLTVAGVCVKLQCNGVRDLAETILEEYRKQCKMEIDLNLPQYVCMAVHQACRLKKVKILKSKILETCRLRPAQWSKLEGDWTKFVDKHFAASKKKRDRSVKNTDVDDEMEVDTSQKQELPSEPQIEPYEDWKKRILEAAYKELKQLEESEKQHVKKQKVEKIEEDRRSPRKNSQNLTPKRSSQILSPRKRRDSRKNSLVFSPSKDQQPTAQVSQHLSSRKVSEGLSPRKENILSLRKAVVVVERLSLSQDQKPIMQVCQDLSSRKLSQGLSSRKENRVSPRKNSPMQEDMSPRRSPRKTPLKDFPYRPPTAKVGVRLLFPIN